MVITPNKTSIFVRITKVPGRYAVLDYCVQIVETQQKTCVREQNPYKPHQEETATFSALKRNTNYTVQGWLVNRQHVIGPKAAQVVQTLFDRKFYAFLSKKLIRFDFIGLLLLLFH